MGSFAITYDDFTGGHYMGNRSTAQPSNSWTGINTMLDPRGNLIATDASLLTTFETGITTSPTSYFYMNGCFSHSGYVTVAYTYFDGGTGTPTSYINSYYATNPLGPAWLSPTTLTGTPVGYMAADQTTATPTLFYVTSTGDVRKLTFTGFAWNDTLATAGTSARTSLYKYKYRLLGIGFTGSIRNRLYYSDATMTTWSATDYYEFPGQITNLATRTNDFVVTTTAGIYSVTGVLGESVNIQEIYSFDELSQGMANPVGYGRDFVYLNDYLDSMNGKIYAGLGAGKSLIGTIDLEANPPLNIGLTNPGMIVVMSNTGYTYSMDSEGRWVRFSYSNWDTTDLPFDDRVTPSAISLSDFPGNMYLAQSILKPYENDTSDAVLYIARVDGVDIKLYASTHTRRAPYPFATGSCLLAEYWHQKPMVVRQVIVEVEYESTGANASIAVNIIPTGAVDINTATAPSMTSSTITAPTETTASTIIHRFRVDNAGRAYGFKPNITHKGVRIRRVICICED